MLNKNNGVVTRGVDDETFQLQSLFVVDRRGITSGMEELYPI